jgi:hypothetical protein
VEQRFRDGRLDPEAQMVVRCWIDCAKTHLKESDRVEAFLKEPWPFGGDAGTIAKTLGLGMIVSVPPRDGVKY